MNRRLVEFTLLAMSTMLMSISVHAKKHKWKVTYPDGKTETLDYDDSTCQMVGWQRKFNFSATFNVLEKYQGQAGFNLTADHLRELDNLETDFGLQFEGLCKDHMLGVYRGHEALYDCRRGNINNALSDLRGLNLLLNTVSTIQDAAAKKDSVSAILDNYKQHIDNQCTKNALQVQTDSLDFGSNETEKSVVITNIGYYEISWSAIDVPRGFCPSPPGGSLARNSSLNLVVYRLAGNPAPPPRSFLIKDNQNDQQIIHLELSGDNVFQAMKLQIKQKLIARTQTQDTVGTAASVVQGFYANAPKEIDYWVTGELLNQLGDSVDAAKSLSKASRVNPNLQDHSQFKLDVAVAKISNGDIGGARKIVGELLKSQPVAMHGKSQRAPTKFYQTVYEQLGNPASAKVLSHSLKVNGYDLPVAVQYTGQDSTQQPN